MPHLVGKLVHRLGAGRARSGEGTCGPGSPRKGAARPPALPPTAHRQHPALLVVHIDELAPRGQKDLRLVTQHMRLPPCPASERAAEVRQVVHAWGSARHPAGAGPELSRERRRRLQALRPPTARRGLRRKAAAAEAGPGPERGGRFCGPASWRERPVTTGAQTLGGQSRGLEERGKPEGAQMGSRLSYNLAQGGVLASDHLPDEQSRVRYATPGFVSALGVTPT